MTCSFRRSAGLALALTAAATAAAILAQEPTPTPSPDVAALRARIARLPAAQIDTQAVVEAAEQAIATDAPPPPATPQASAGSQPGIGEVRPPLRTMRFSELRFVWLPPDDEAKSRAAVSQQVRQHAPASPLVFFDGAFRTRATDATELTLKAVAIGGLPLRYQSKQRRFEGNIQVGVVDIGGRRATRQLSEPIAFQVLGPVTASPELVKVDSTAPPYESVTIASESPDPSVAVRVYSWVSNDSVDLQLPVLPALFVTVSPQEIQGWGLEKADVLVSSRALASGGNRQVQLSWDRGIVEPDELELGAAGSAKAKIRSAATGLATVTASAAAMSPGSGTVQLVFPTRFLIAGLVGGLAGGILLVRWPRRGGWPRAFGRLFVAVITGAIVFALFALGVNVTGFPLPAQAGEVLVFVVAALGAYLGAGVIKPVTPA